MPSFRGETISSLASKRRNLRSGPPPKPASNPKIVNREPNTVGNYWAVRATFVPSKQGGPKQYETVIVFYGIDFLENPTAKAPIKVRVLGRQYRYMTLPRLSQSPVKISCTCADYYWTWWYWNKKNNALSGVDFPHPSTVTGSSKRKTDGRAYGSKGPGERNKKHTPGLCKHVAKLADTLVKKNEAAR